MEPEPADASGRLDLRATLGRHRSRLALLAVLGGYFGLLWHVGGLKGWDRLGVGAEGAWFADLRNVTSAWDCTRKGIPVLPFNPCDPYHDPANYPRLWLLPSHLGLGQGDTVTLGIVVVLLFFAAAVAVLPGRASVGTTVLYALALCSPAVMLGVQRGNVDILLFAIVALAVLVSRRGLRGLIAADALVFVAASLKLFPVFAIGFLVPRRTRAALVSIAAVVAGFALYALAIRHELSQIHAALPQTDTFSFGVRRVSDWMSAWVEGTSATGASLPSWDVLLLVLAGAVAWLTARRVRPSLGTARTAAELRDLDLFWAGACVYVGSYAVARNFDYRLVFLLLALPQIARWAEARSRLAHVTIVALLAAMWLDGFYTWFIERWLRGWSAWTAAGPDGQTLPLAAIAQFALWLTLAAWLVATAPGLPRLRLFSARAPRTSST
jgi:hypothetical protein